MSEKPRSVVTTIRVPEEGTPPPFPDPGDEYDPMGSPVVVAGRSAQMAQGWRLRTKEELDRKANRAKNKAAWAKRNGPETSTPADDHGAAARAILAEDD